MEEEKMIVCTAVTKLYKPSIFSETRYGSFPYIHNTAPNKYNKREKKQQ